MGLNISTKENLPKLETTFCVEGEFLTRKIKFYALRFNYVLSPCEKYLYVQLCNSNSDDSGRFVKIDVSTGKKIYSVMPEWGWARDYAFSEGGDLIAETNHYGPWLVDDHGNITDRGSYYICRVKSADYGTMRALPEFFELHGKTPETCAVAMDALERFLGTCPSMFHGLSYGALALKSRAEVQIYMGDNKEALQSCVDALYLDPKVTVKRMLNSLIKKLNLDKDSLHPSEWVSSMKVEIDINKKVESTKVEKEHLEIKNRNEMSIGKFQNIDEGESTKRPVKYLMAVIILVAVAVFLSNLT